MHRSLGIWLFVVVIMLFGMGLLMIPRGEAAPPSLAGTTFSHWRAPGFALRDQNGQRVTQAQFRGEPVILTFMDARCTQLCPVVAETIRRSLTELGADARRVGVVVVSTDPEGDTPATARAFSRQHGMLHRWHYLLGPRQSLAPLWRRYYVYAAPASAPASVRDSHTSVTYVIDPGGYVRVLMGGDPGTSDLVRDLRIVAGLPVGVTVQSSVPAPEVGHLAPDFALRALNGSRVTLRSLRGRVVLLNFWATWCTACKSEMPLLSRWFHRYGSSRFTILGVDQQESASDVRSRLRQLNIAYPVITDDRGDVSARYDVYGLPASFLIDQRGVVLSVTMGTLKHGYVSRDLVPALRQADL